MYKVISISLTGLFINALVLSMIGTIVYSPLAMIASVAVLGFSVYLASLLFGLLLGVRVHAESSFITALILFFIFMPTLEVGGLVALGLVGFIAAASKFILVFRGRHIFNAAAISACIVSLAGLAYATWWVATPPLIPLTVILGYFIIQKTRRVHMSGLFMGISVVIIGVSLLKGGSSAAASLGLLLSWPIFFFSAFMLTEPLTLPPKKWQQVIGAILVAVLFSIPLHVGDFVAGPAFALIAGNLLAFGFRRQPAIALEFQKRRQLTPTSYEFIFKPTKQLSYAPGQYVEMTIPHKNDDLRGMRRSFSITSAPGEATVRFGVKFYQPSSSFKQTLKALPIGSMVQVTGINGDFTLPKDSNRPLLFIAGGIGITPFMSHLQSLKLGQVQGDIVLVYAVNNEAEIAYKDILIAMNVRVIVVTIGPINTSLPVKWQLVNEERITQEMLQAQIPDIANRTAYISGPPLMIDSTKRHLKKLKVRKIKTDYFIGY